LKSQTGRKTKTVQWFSDLKKRPQDISDDRKIVKSQVKIKHKEKKQKYNFSNELEFINHNFPQM